MKKSQSIPLHQLHLNMQFYLVNDATLYTVEGYPSADGSESEVLCSCTRDIDCNTEYIRLSGSTIVNPAQ